MCTAPSPSAFLVTIIADVCAVSQEQINQISWLGTMVNDATVVHISLMLMSHAKVWRRIYYSSQRHKPLHGNVRKCITEAGTGDAYRSLLTLLLLALSTVGNLKGGYVQPIDTTHGHGPETHTATYILF